MQVAPFLSNIFAIGVYQIWNFSKLYSI